MHEFNGTKPHFVVLTHSHWLSISYVFNYSYQNDEYRIFPLELLQRKI